MHGRLSLVWSQRKGPDKHAQFRGKRYATPTSKSCLGECIAEAASVAEKWVEHFWSGLCSLPFEKLARSSRSDEGLARLLIEQLANRRRSRWWMTARDLTGSFYGDSFVKPFLMTASRWG